MGCQRCVWLLAILNRLADSLNCMLAAGDSRAVLVQRHGHVEPLSEDHKPNRPDEVSSFYLFIVLRGTVIGLLMVALPLTCSTNVLPYVLLSADRSHQKPWRHGVFPRRLARFRSTCRVSVSVSWSKCTMGVIPKVIMQCHRRSRPQTVRDITARDTAVAGA